MNIEELRKQVIECRTLEEMRTVWEALRGMGESMLRDTFDYNVAHNLIGGSVWSSAGFPATLSYQDFMAEFGNPNIDKELLRSKIIGGFQSIDEMKDAMDCLVAVGESVTIIPGINRLRFESSIKNWICCNTFAANMTLQELKNFLQPEDHVENNELECHCKSLIHGHSLGCHYFKER